jgi:hypothetical protein
MKGIAKHSSRMPRKRERLELPHESRFIRRDERGRFTSAQVDVGNSLQRDRRQKAKADNPGGQGDHGDRKS